MNKLELLEAIRKLTVDELMNHLERIDNKLNAKTYKNIEDILYTRLEIENELNVRL